MSPLQTLIHLSHKVTVYCPSQDDKGNPIPNAQLILDKTLIHLSEAFGGATASDAIGCWIGASGQIVREAVTLVFAYANELTEHDTIALLEHCAWVKDVGKQEAVALEIDGDLYFV